MALIGILAMSPVRLLMRTMMFLLAPTGQDDKLATDWPYSRFNPVSFNSLRGMLRVLSIWAWGCQNPGFVPPSVAGWDHAGWGCRKPRAASIAAVAILFDVTVCSCESSVGAISSIALKSDVLIAEEKRRNKQSSAHVSAINNLLTVGRGCYIYSETRFL